MRQQSQQSIARIAKLLPGLILAGAMGCDLDLNLDQEDGPSADNPGGDISADGLVPVAAVPGEPVPANDPAVIALDEDGPGWTPGQESFISADGQWATYYGAGWGMPYGPAGGAASANPYAEGDGRSVEQGDVYAALDDDTLVNLNAYRGLQVIDVSDLSAPRVVSRLPLAGVAVELYVVERQAIVLLNGWQAYAGSSAEVLSNPAQGGVVLVIDLTDALAPRVSARHPLTGVIAQSRLTCGDGEQALFVASTSVDEQYVWETHLESFSVTSDGALEARSELLVDGAVSVIQATPEAMLVARPDVTGQASRVLVVDISDPKGAMVAGADVTLAGFVANHTNLDYRGGILRAASTRWNGTQSENHLQTFETGSSAAGVTPVDDVTFAPGETLFGTQFLEGSAFVVTYLRQDPLHAFEIDPAGQITMRSEFIVSGWNDFFRPVLDQTRMIGVGVDDANGQRFVALSLYDVTDLENPTPLIERRNVPVAGAWTNAATDHRIFAVMEDVVQIESDPAGATETGLLMLPVTGYDAQTGATINGTQLFSFSAESLTARGFLPSAGAVRRAFPAAGAAATLSDLELATFDASDPDAPVALGSANLSPNYVYLEDYGDYWVRVEDRSMLGGYTTPPPAEVQIIARQGDPDLAEALATFEIPAGAQTVRAGDSFVSLVSAYVTQPDGTYTYETALQVFDLSDPTAPREAGSLSTERIEPFYGSGYTNGSYGSYYGEYGYTDYCYGAYPSDYYSSYGCGSMPTAEAYAVGDDAIAFVRHLPQQRLLGSEHYCVSYPEQGTSYGCAAGTDCSVLQGYVECRSLEDGPERCTNTMQRCRTLADGTWQCEAIADEELADIDTVETCYDYDVYRYWESYAIDVLDLSDPDRPALRATLAMPVDEEDTGLYVDGANLYVIFKVPVAVEGDPRPFVRYYFRRIDLSDPEAPRLSAAVNVPGELIGIEGETIYTRDFVWGDNVIEPAVNRLELDRDQAALQARRVFVDEEAYRAALDGDGRLLVTHRVAQVVAARAPGFDAMQWRPVLSVLDARGDLSATAEVELDTWMTFQDAYRGRAVVGVPSGLLVLDLQANEVEPRAFFPSLGQPRRPTVEGSTMTFAAGLYGIYTVDLDAINLTTP